MIQASAKGLIVFGAISVAQIAADFTRALDDFHRARLQLLEAGSLAYEDVCRATDPPHLDDSDIKGPRRRCGLQMSFRTGQSPDAWLDACDQTSPAPYPASDSPTPRYIRLGIVCHWPWTLRSNATTKIDMTHIILLRK